MLRAAAVFFLSRSLESMGFLPLPTPGSTTPDSGGWGWAIVRGAALKGLEEADKRGVKAHPWSTRGLWQAPSSLLLYVILTTALQLGAVKTPSLQMRKPGLREMKYPSLVGQWPPGAEPVAV